MPKKTLAQRWEQVKPHFTLADLALDAFGKFLLGIGIGALLASTLASYGWWCVGIGLGLSAIVKAKHFRRFWS